MQTLDRDQDMVAVNELYGVKVFRRKDLSHAKRILRSASGSGAFFQIERAINLLLPLEGIKAVPFQGFISPLYRSDKFIEKCSH